MKIGLEATEINVSSVRQNLSKIIDGIRVGGERIIVTQHGRPVAAVIDVEDLKLLQILEDRMDVAEARRRMKEPTDKVSLEELRSRSFLEDKPHRRETKKSRDGGLERSPPSSRQARKHPSTTHDSLRPAVPAADS